MYRNLEYVRQQKQKQRENEWKSELRRWGWKERQQVNLSNCIKIQLNTMNTNHFLWLYKVNSFTHCIRSWDKFQIIRLKWLLFFYGYYTVHRSSLIRFDCDSTVSNGSQSRVIYFFRSTLWRGRSLDLDDQWNHAVLYIHRPNQSISTDSYHLQCTEWSRRKYKRTTRYACSVWVKHKNRCEKRKKKGMHIEHEYITIRCIENQNARKDPI